MIQSFKDRDSERVFKRTRVTRWHPNLQIAALHRLDVLDVAESLAELAALPSNRLEALKGERQGQYSIRINRQWRICFRGEDGDAQQVEITDYH